jgi:Mannosyltransferase (PIG-V)
MPVADVVLTDLPAEQDLLAAAERGEVEQTAIEILDQDAGGLDLLDAGGERRRSTLELGVCFREIGRSQVAAVRADLRPECRAVALSLGELTMPRNHFLGDRPKLVERVVCLSEGEVASDAHLRMIRAVVPTGQRLRPVLDLFLWSRAAIWAGVVFAFLLFEPNRAPRADRWDDPEVTRDLGLLVDVWARWDSVWVLRIAEHDYGAAEEGAAAFYPLYPLLVGVLGRILLGHYVLAGVVISLAFTLGSLVLLYRLAESKLGTEAAGRAVLYLAIFPFAVFLQAVYGESLFLFLTLAAFMLAERGTFLGAGVAAGLAWLTRPLAVALLPALVLIAWRSPRRGRALLELTAAPALFALYPLWLWWRLDEPFAFVHAEDVWSRHVSWAGPLGGLWDGLRAGWAGVRQLASGSDTTRYWSAVQDTDPDRVAAINLEQLAFLVLFAALTVVVWRRFGAPYGLFAALSLAIPLSVPSERWPLLSIPRFGLAVFPFFLALAVLGARPRVNTVVIVVSAMLLGIVCVQWALWQWVA